jgi:hypothetical protein
VFLAEFLAVILVKTLAAVIPAFLVEFLAEFLGKAGGYQNASSWPDEPPLPLPLHLTLPRHLTHNLHHLSDLRSKNYRWLHPSLLYPWRVSYRGECLSAHSSSIR